MKCLTVTSWDDKIRPLTLRSQSVSNLPPSSSGLGRSPFKATTGVRIPVGAQISMKPPTGIVERFLSLLRVDSTGKVSDLAKL
jgi:hypothetical protein